MMLTENEVDADIIKCSKFFHFGTLSLTDERVRKATEKAVRIAKENKILITFDPNLRPPLWKSLEDAKEQILFGLSQCDVLKISEEELEFVTDIKDIGEAICYLRSRYSISLILVTMGASGSVAFYKNFQVERPAFLQQNTIETTGAGDTFFGAFINFLLEYGLDQLSESNLAEILTFANAAASLITTRKGALRVMPEKQEVDDFIKSSRQKED